MDFPIIHVVLGKANPERMNGVNKVVNSLVQNMVETGRNVSLWGITKDLTVNYPQREYQTELFIDRGRFKLDLSIAKKLSSLPENTVFHLHGAFIPQFYLLSRLLVKFGFRYIYTSHGAFNSVAMRRSRWKKKIYIRLFERFVVQHAHRLHFIGMSEVTGSKKIFGQRPYVLIPNGQEVRSIHSESYRTEKALPVFGFVGRLDIHTKGLDILITGFAKFLVKSGHSADLWIIGDGPERKSIEYMVRDLGIEEHVKFLGARFGDEKMTLIRQMDYLCLTSRNEGLPGVVLEAASIGTPVIVSQETNLSEYVDEASAGLILQNNDSENIEKAMSRGIKAIWDGSIIDMGHNAKLMISEKFDWARISSKMFEVYAA